MTCVNSILDTIGNTPVVRLNHIAPPGISLYAKLESANPMGSVKDRAALAIIEAAEQAGELSPGQTVVEASSGNTGISLAMVCAAKGYPLVVCMAENFSIERRKLLRFLGAKVVLTPASAKGSGMMAKARELAEANGWFLCRQFENPANAAAHREGTAREILAAFSDRTLDYLVAGCGTGGTLAGVSEALREASPGTRIVACEPDNSPMLAMPDEQPLDESGEISGSHPKFRPHIMQGWTPDFISPLTADALERVDQVVQVCGHEALRLSRELASREGILVGITGGATVAGALQLAVNARPGSNILCLLPDTGERYLSTFLFDGVPVDMTDIEWELSRSTPAARFDAPPTSATPAITVANADREADAFIAAALDDEENAIIMFAHEWCEFCWSVRKAFAHYGIAYRTIDLDSAEYKANDFGMRVRRRLQARTNCLTIPQIFVAGEFLGGCTETFDAIRDGSLFARLPTHVAAAPERVDRDPYDFLPGWLQPR